MANPVQQASNSVQAASASLQISGTQGLATFGAGDAGVCWCSWANGGVTGTASTATVTDSGSHTWTPISGTLVDDITHNNTTSQAWYCANAGGATWVQWNSSTNRTYVTADVVELPGLMTLDATGVSGATGIPMQPAGTTNAAKANSVTPTSTGLMIAFAFDAALNSTTQPAAGTGFTGFATANVNLGQTVSQSRAEWAATTGGVAKQATFTPDISSSYDWYHVMAVAFDNASTGAALAVAGPVGATGPGISPNAIQQFRPQLGDRTGVPITFATVTGVSGTSGIGTVVPSSAVALIGVSGTSSVGNVIATPQLALTGIAGTASVGSVVPSTTIKLTGIAAVSGVGTVTTSGGILVGTGPGLLPQPGPGLGSPFNLNQFLAGPVSYQLPPNTSGSAALTGVTGTGSVGSVGTQNSGGTATLTGVSGTGSVGSVVPSTTVAMLGVTGTSGVGSVLPSNSIALTGLFGTGGVGNVAPGTGSFAVPVTGVSSTGSVGSVNAPAGVPSIVGLYLVDAMNALRSANLSIGSITYYFGKVPYAVNPTHGEAIVLTQSPAAGLIVGVGAYVDVTVTFDLARGGATDLSPSANNNHLSATESKILPL